MRLDILRKTSADGDPAKMIPPEVTVITIPSVRAIAIGRNVNPGADRSGDLVYRTYKLELIDPVHETDTLVIGGSEYRVKSVLERNMGNFSVWIVEAYR
jgi:hypothetical protein